MSEKLPRYMNKLEFRAFTGLKRNKDTKFLQKYGIAPVYQGTHKLIEVAPALRLLVQEPGIEFRLGDRWPMVKAAVEAMQQSNEAA